MKKKSKKNARTTRYGVQNVKIESDSVVKALLPEGGLRKLGSLGVNPNLPESVTGQRVDASPVVMTILWHRIFSRQNMTA